MFHLDRCISLADRQINSYAAEQRGDTLIWVFIAPLGFNIGYGRIIFSGISPVSVKSRIPHEMIPAGETLSKRIMPLKTLAFRSKSEKIKAGQSNFYPGILPNGRNTVGLVITQEEREWKVPLTVLIAER